MTEPTTGGALLDGIVARFYALVLADPRLEPWFAGIDMARLEQHQAEFLGTALDGGDSPYDLRAAHAGLGIDDDAFDRVAGHLGEALTAAGLDPGHIRELLTVVGALRGDIVEV